MNRLVWFRNDLRLHDNEMLTRATADPGTRVNFVYVYDRQWETQTPEGFPRVGPHRRRFIAESVRELRRRLRELGGDLICVVGDPVGLIPDLCARLRIDELYFSELSSFDEHHQGTAIRDRAKGLGVRSVTFDAQTLIRPEDHPRVDLTRLKSFSKLRKIVEDGWIVRPPIEAEPRSITSQPFDLPTHLTTWDPEAFINHAIDQRGFKIGGGEAAGLARVRHYFWESDRLRRYKETRNGLVDLDDSSKFSAGLSVGALSARSLYAEVRRYEIERVANGSTLWFLYELLWRDYFAFTARARGHGLFTEPWVPRTGPKTPDQQRRSFERWRDGRTERPFVDAGMNELRRTGWLSNRMRQNVASFLVHALGGNWRSGARWFESCLIDYDTSSNWGNWSYVTGTGPNQSHVFDVDQQARMYDPDGEYQERWAEGC